MAGFEFNPNKNFAHKLIILPESKILKYWQVIVGISMIESALLYPYCLGFGFPEDFPFTMDLITA